MIASPWPAIHPGPLLVGLQGSHSPSKKNFISLRCYVPPGAPGLTPFPHCPDGPLLLFEQFCVPVFQVVREKILPS